MSGRRRSHQPPGGEAEGWQIGDSVGRLLEGSGMGDVRRLGAVASCFEAVLPPALSGHAAAAGLEGEVLLVAVDHPALASELAFAGAKLLERLAACLGDEQVRRLKVTVRGSRGLE